MTDQNAKIDEILDQQEQTLKFALAKAMSEMNKAATVQNIRNYEAARKALESHDIRKKATTSGGKLETKTEAAHWVISNGYMVKLRSAIDHIEAGVPRQKDGSWLIKDVEDFANRKWENPQKQIETLGTGAGREELIAEQIRKLRLGNEITEKNYILRSLVEQEFASRASYLKRDLLNLGPRFIDRFIDNFSTILKELEINIEGINLNALVPDLESYWELKISEHLHEYSRARGFIPPQGDTE